MKQIRRTFDQNRFLTPFLLLSYVLCLCFASTGASEAQAKEAQPPSKDTAPVVEIAKSLVNDVDDIDRLRILNPLKLSSGQLTKLIDFLSKAQEDYDKKLASLVADPLKEIADEVKKMKKEMISGGTVSKEFDLKVKKIQMEYAKKKEGLWIDNISKSSAECKRILTEEQISVAAKMEIAEFKKIKADVKGSEEQMFNQYVVDTFMSYYRIVPLLKEMKSAEK